jgi:The GLUG motif.
MTSTSIDSTGRIQGFSSVGGVVGHIESTGLVTFTNVFFSGRVNVPYSNSEGTGGIIGTINNSASKVKFENVRADGTIYGFFNVGGLVGRSDGVIDIANSSFTGTLYARGTDANGGAGGLIGKASDNVTLFQSYSSATIEGVNNLGGLIGALQPSGANLNRYAPVADISVSYSEGSITGGGNNAGGLIGTNSFNATISNCYSTCSVDSDSYVGGLIGSVDEGLKFRDNVYNGGTDGTVGHTVETKLKNCYTSGEFINARISHAGGLVGIIRDGGDLFVTDCYSMPHSITGGSHLGSVIGEALPNYVNSKSGSLDVTTKVYVYAPLRSVFNPTCTTLLITDKLVTQD